MKTIYAPVLYFLLLFLGASSCDKEEIFQEPEVRTLMPLGDSRVAGGTSHDSYRYDLWKLLIGSGYAFDFTGSNSDPRDYSALHGLEFDRDHEGTGGARTTDILEVVNELDNAEVPDLILMGIGGNDLASGERTVPEVKTNILQIIEILRSKKPNITIFLEQIAPGRSDFMTSERWILFQEFKSSIMEISTLLDKADARVIPIDMSQGWSDDLLADNVHYNAKGAQLVAQRYYDALLSFLEE